MPTCQVLSAFSSFHVHVDSELNEHLLVSFCLVFSLLLSLIFFNAWFVMIIPYFFLDHLLTLLLLVFPTHYYSQCSLRDRRFQISLARSMHTVCVSPLSPLPFLVIVSSSLTISSKYFSPYFFRDQRFCTSITLSFAYPVFLSTFIPVFF